MCLMESNTLHALDFPPTGLISTKKWRFAPMKRSRSAAEIEAVLTASEGASETAEVSEVADTFSESFSCEAFSLEQPITGEQLDPERDSFSVVMLIGVAEVDEKDPDINVRVNYSIVIF